MISRATVKVKSCTTRELLCSSVPVIMAEREFSLKLVQEIESRPSLYNFNLIEYTNKDITEKEWTEVAKAVGEEVNICKEKWKNIRTVFGRCLKKGITEGSATYYLYDNLKFLIPFMRKLELIQDDTEVCNDVQIIYTSSSPNREYDESGTNPNKSEQITENDHYDIDMKNIAAQFYVINTENLDNSRRNVGNTRGSFQKEQIVKNKNPKHFEMEKKSNYEVCKLEEDAKRDFLMSLIPDLNSMDNKQMRHFKKRVLDVVNRILDSDEST